MGPSTRLFPDLSRSRDWQEAFKVGRCRRSVKRLGRRRGPITTNNAAAKSKAPYLATSCLSEKLFTAVCELALHELSPLLRNLEISWPDSLIPEGNDRDALFEDYRTSDHFCFRTLYELRRDEEFKYDWANVIAPTEPFGTRYWSPYAQLRKTSDAFVALTRSTDSVNNLRYDFVQLRNFQHLQKLSNVKFQQGNWSSRTAHNHTISVESRLPSDYTCPFYAPQIAEPTSGSRTLQTWKSGPGRKKDWRRCVYTGIPINAPNLGRMFHFKYQPHSRKSSVRGSCRWTTELADIEVDVNFEISMLLSSGMLEEHLERKSPSLNCTFGLYGYLHGNIHGSFRPIYRTSFNSNQYLISKRCRSTVCSIAHNIPYENFVGAMLGHSIRLLVLLRHELHGDVYAAEYLFEQVDLTVKAYLIRGVSKKDREYRVRNLKRLADKPSFVGSLEQSGRKWLISFREPPENPKPALRYRGPDRRNWTRYAAEFPSLAQAYRPKDLPAHDTKIIIMEELKAEALRISSSQSQPSLAARLISRLIESNPSWSDEKLAMSQAGDAKKPKSPEQIDYARERQRIARKAKRLQKKF